MTHDIELPHHGAARLQGSALSSICQRLLDAELQSGLAEGRDYSINLQRGKRPNQQDNDTAPEKLVRGIQQNVWRRPTFSAFHKLLNNYTRDTGVAESITPEKEGEISAFLDGAMQSAPLRLAHEFLASKGLVASDPTQFKSQLYQMWFRLYTREARDDTCGFEHVFVGESKNGELQGLHNWLQFYNLEQCGNLDYRGFIFPRRRGGGIEGSVTPQDLIVSVQFNIDGQVKDVSSIWLGTSPEFELALYTLCFIAGGEKSVIQLSNPTGVYEVEIRCYHIHSKYGDKVGSAFPVLLSKQASEGAPSQHNLLPQQPPVWQGGSPPQQQQPGGYPQAQQSQQDSANQGCGSILAELLKAILSRLGK